MSDDSTPFDVSPSPYPKEITEAIAKVMGADLYVQKRGKNAFHGYKYATVGDLLDKLQPLMAEAGLIVFQHEAGSDFLDGGNVMAVRYEFTLAHTSGAVWPEKPAHTGMSSCRNTKGGFDDKAANKCHTAARKYFLLGLFQVPTGDDYREGAHDGDTDSQDHAPPPLPQRDQSNGRAYTPPPPIEPPQPPQMSDVEPHKIALVTANTGLPNWIDFGGKIVAAYNGATSIGDLAEWEGLNIETLNQMAAAAPKAHALVMKRRNENKDRLSPPMLTPEEAGKALQ